MTKAKWMRVRTSIVRNLSGVNETFMVDPDLIMSSNSWERVSSLGARMREERGKEDRTITYAERRRNRRPVTPASEGLFCICTRKGIHFSMPRIASIGDEILGKFVI